VPRSTYYHRPRPESAENLRLLRRLDELYLDCPFFGSRRMAVTLEVNRKRIQRMRILGIEALYPKPRIRCSLSDSFTQFLQHCRKSCCNSPSRAAMTGSTLSFSI
jgi:hypothetical protein